MPANPGAFSRGSNMITDKWVAGPTQDHFSEAAPFLRATPTLRYNKVCPNVYALHYIV